VDNLPVSLIPPFCELLQRSGDSLPRAAAVVDVRERHLLEQFPEILENLRRRDFPVTVVFFDARDDVLKRRFSETRRPHPVAGAGGGLEEAIRSERERLAPLRDLSDRIIDTSRFNAHELRAFLKATFGATEGAHGLTIHIVSFGFKYGVPTEADLLFDLRFLPNPYFVDHLRPLDGRTRAVQDFLEAQHVYGESLGRIVSFVDYLIPLYRNEGKSYLTVTLGCTGGKHRSVAAAEALRRHLEAAGVPASVTHRDADKE
jgi:UPF0042 nucleotide-binding protein